MYSKKLLFIVFIVFFLIELILFFSVVSMKMEFSALKADQGEFSDSINEIRSSILEVNDTAHQLEGAVESAQGQIQDFTIGTKDQIEDLEEQLASAVSGDIRARSIAQSLNSVVRVVAGPVEGTGIVVAQDLILTNDHVVSGESAAQIQFHNGDSLRGAVIKVDKRLDLALLRVEEVFPSEISLTFSPTIQPGQEIYVIGNPKGVPFTVTDGIISSTANRLFNDIRYFQISAPINHGNSGGPVLDYTGDVVGIVTRKELQYEGVAFALPASNVLSFIEDV